METNLKKLLNSKIEYNLSETNYTIPIADESIRSNLQMYKKETIGSCLQRYNIDILNNYNKCINDLMCSESFFINPDPKVIYKPNKSGNPNDSKGYYIENQNYDELNRDLHDIKDIIEPSTKFITGGRGIGKTLTINILLIRNFDFLCKNKIIFTRCDIKKFQGLKLHERKHDGKEKFGIANYIDCQFLYILCEKLDLPFYQNILSILKNRTYRYLISKDYTIDEPKFKIVDITSQLEKYQALIRDYQKLHKNDEDDNYARQVLIKSRLLAPYEGSIRAYTNWINLSKEIQLILKNNNYKFWAIVDGIDNINRYDTNGKFQKEFDDILDTTIDFHLEKEGKSFVWFLLRNNTYQLLKSKIKALKPHRLIKEEDHYKFAIEKLNKEDVIKERNRVFKINSDYLKGIELPENINDLCHHFFQEEMIKKSHHIRNYIFNWINFLFWHALYHVKYKSPLFSENFYYSNLILNERLFLETSNSVLQNKQRSDILFNIFYYNTYITQKNPIIWHGWCATRIMQLIESFGDSGVKENKLVLKLSNLFLYNKKQVKLTCQNLMVYGFIRYNDDDDLSIKVTKEGKELINFIYSHLEIIYYCSLDTPLPSFCIKEHHISSHNNSPFIKDFAPNCLNSTRFFLNFLDFQHNKEMKRLNNPNLINIFKNPLDDSEISKSLCKKIKDLTAK